jgi:hypothetical protein
VAPPPLERLSPPRDSACHEYSGGKFHNHYRFALAEAFRAETSWYSDQITCLERDCSQRRFSKGKLMSRD